MTEPMTSTSSIRTPNPRRWKILWLVGVAQLLLNLDVTVVAIALPGRVQRPGDGAGPDKTEFVEFLTYLFSDVLGNSAYVTDGGQRGLGRPPRDFTDYATRTAATRIWTQEADR